VSAAKLLQRRERVLGKKTPRFYDEPLHLVRGEGVYLYAADGKRYLDVYNNVPNVGHCHPHIVKALSDQAQKLNIHTRYLHDTIVDYAERLTATFADPLSAMFYTCTGSEANDLALRMVRNATGSLGVICTDDTYHGNTTAVDELATLFNGGKAVGPNVKAVPAPDSFRAADNLHGAALADAYLADIASAIKEFEQQGIGLAAMLVCPIFANEGVPNVPADYLQKAADLVREHGGKVIFDEVQSGFGRSGKLWGYQFAGVQPDVVTLGKPMGNGHPIAAVISSEEMVNSFREEVMYFNTFGGNPVSCAVANAVLDVMESEKLVANAADVGQYLRAGLSRLQKKYDSIADVRGPGLFIGVELVTDRAKKTPATELAARITNGMKNKGVLISKIGRYDNVLKMRPPIVFSRDNADELLDALGDVLSHEC